MQGLTRNIAVLAVAGALAAAGAAQQASGGNVPAEPAQSAEQAAQQTALRDTADAQELLSEASQLSPEEAGAAAFARLRAQQMQAAAAAASSQVAALKSKLDTGPAPAAEPGRAPAAAAPAAAPEALNWGPWDAITACSGVDLHFALATARDGGEQMRMELVNHNPYSATVTFRPVVLGSDGERQPSAGDYSVTLNPNSTYPQMGDLITFAIAQYGEADMSVKLQGQPGAASATVPCASKTKSVRN